ncbi:MAG: UDP-N-acetylmuramoyl-L-alanine--D-glutamate ligase, partial [Xanthomonadaceae bacterium]|nr:UDP-N-acetylmuramoyl-L-alanine--D-glutamate ligase [Xanthomonadaceae bacterium]
MRFAELEHADVAVWGYGREGRSVLAALRRRFPGKPLTLYCGRDEVEVAQSHGDASLRVTGSAPDAD